jgi:hypothetical protein
MFDRVDAAYLAGNLDDLRQAAVDTVKLINRLAHIPVPYQAREESAGSLGPPPKCRREDFHQGRLFSKY